MIINAVLRKKINGLLIKIINEIATKNVIVKRKKNVNVIFKIKMIVILICIQNISCLLVKCLNLMHVVISHVI